MNTDERCTRCGGEISPNAGEKWSDGWCHSEFVHCYHSALARAEAAEKRADELEFRLRTDPSYKAQYELAAKAVYSASEEIVRLRARLAELEAALGGMDNHMARLLTERNHALDRAETLEQLAAAAEWRPVTEEPPSLGYYLTVDFYGVCELCYWENDEWQSFDYPGYRPTHWQPLPPPPTTATTESTP